LTLLHWREPSQATWVPLLDTKLLSRLASGRKSETYFPVAVADNKFHCIILKGGDKYPYFPRPLLSEFDFQIPISSKSQPDTKDDDSDDEGGDEMKKLEGEFVLKSILSTLKSDLVKSTASTHTERTELAMMEVEIDKTLLKMMMAECIEGEDRGMRALEMVQLMRDRTGRMIEAAGKIADKYERAVLGEKIRELGEARLMEMDED
jgi:chromosome transmission fidelity protein 4